MALLQFGTTLVFAVPPLWNNENQPDPNLRKAQAILGKNFPVSVRHIAIPAAPTISSGISYHQPSSFWYTSTFTFISYT